YDPSGKIYAKAFFGNLHITGNNFIKYVPGLSNITVGTVLRVRPGNEVWVYEKPEKISILRNDTLWKVIESKNRQLRGIYEDAYNGRFFALEITGSKLTLYEFKNYEW